ncbi:hypothetical protein [Jannaschia seohaensis]|uniref:Gfo/Idh/MocA-like oxidoreductase C-terminal domain-containing protein n=1 Tax=Jannaschia seohaensis TaxID=475081 RepID=A0A2Y9A272_9RHOB|nr:hypothetical protein [Jannaschia seohaensis]PWJ21678.1 hypothetical protein BCF38_10184 [Jannaschia seohaensis]SSA37956.1 hypothetical protein SAMN05421539_10184 [Jannaschia seohaensis]
MPPGYPEGYLEGFANIYSEAADASLAAREDKSPDSAVHSPTAQDGLAGVRFVDACVRSLKANARWVTLD